jgi:hypothetical protein
MSLTYAIADLHGRYDLLSEAVTKIVEHSKSDRPATIITLGDYVDRGPKSRQVIERLMDWGSPDLKLVCLKGNHEDIIWQCCRQPIKAGWWMDNGGGATLISYGQNYGDIVNVKIVPEQHLRFCPLEPAVTLTEFKWTWSDGPSPGLCHAKLIPAPGGCYMPRSSSTRCGSSNSAVSVPPLPGLLPLRGIELF